MQAPQHGHMNRAPPQSFWRSTLGSLNWREVAAWVSMAGVRSVRKWSGGRWLLHGHGVVSSCHVYRTKVVKLIFLIENFCSSSCMLLAFFPISSVFHCFYFILFYGFRVCALHPRAGHPILPARGCVMCVCVLELGAHAQTNRSKRGSCTKRLHVFSKTHALMYNS